ncbi:MAG TPA: LysR substrate-binding domain-containing protein [Anaeromyxobacteraceae bacterium]
MQRPAFDLLALFEAVARTRSFSVAARELGMPKSSVSRGIARLEASLGAQLLFRTTRHVALSTAGTALYDEVTPLLAGLRRAVSGVPGREELPSGELRVTAPADVGALFLAEVVTRYTARYPAVRVELHLTGRVVDLVAEGFDLALRVGERLRDSSLVARRAAPVVLQLYASPLYLARRGVPRGEADLAGHDGVFFRSGPQKLRIPRLDGASALRPRVVCDDLLFARDAMRAGAGIGLLPTFVAAPEVAAGALVRVLTTHERTAGYLHIVTPGGRHVSRKVAAFRDLALELLRGGPTRRRLA